MNFGQAIAGGGVLPKNERLSFGDAVAALKEGLRVAREGWNGKGMWLVLINPGNAMFTKGGSAYPMQPCIGMKTASGEMQPGWLASQTDILAEDWMVIENREQKEAIAQFNSLIDPFS